MSKSRKYSRGGACPALGWREAIALCHRAQRKIVALYDFKRERTVYL
jgi:hypothetical protein